jgi:hypothetical protein
VRRFFRDGWDFGVFTLVIAVPVAITFAAAIVYMFVNGFAAMPELVASNPWRYGPLAAFNIWCLYMLVRSLVQARRPEMDESESNG